MSSEGLIGNLFYSAICLKISVVEEQEFGRKISKFLPFEVLTSLYLPKLFTRKLRLVCRKLHNA